MGNIKIITLILSLLLVFSANCEDSTSYIVGGEDATIQDHPYMAGVFLFGFPLCTGAIISSRTVLTAAHCILHSIPNSASVSVGSSRRSGEGGLTYRALRVHVHPEYYSSREPFMMQADLAIIQTILRIVFRPTVQPIEIAVEEIPAASDVLLIGWGLVGDSFLQDRADQLQKVEMSTIPNVVCLLLYTPLNRQTAVTDEKVCVFNGNNRGVGGGDSGGPLIWQGKVVGVTSWTSRPYGSHPSVYIRLSHHIDWIRQYM